MPGFDEVMTARVDKALLGHKCVGAWLGHGEVLFCGFGPEVLPERGEDGKRCDPPYELTSNCAEWSIERAGVKLHGVNLDGDERASLERAALDLVGLEVRSWSLVEPQHGIDVVFDDGRVLQVRGWTDGAEGETDAWSLSAQDNKILAVSNLGQAVIVEASLPIRDWFS